jgi:hypothetical protein
MLILGTAILNQSRLHECPFFLGQKLVRFRRRKVVIAPSMMKIQRQPDSELTRES